MVQEVEIAYKCIILTFEGENKLYSFHKDITWHNFAFGLMNMYCLHHFYGLRYNSSGGVTAIINCEDDMKHLSRFNPTGHFDILLKDPRVDIRRDPWNNYRNNSAFRPPYSTSFGASTNTGFGSVSSGTGFGCAPASTGFGSASTATFGSSSVAGPSFESSSGTGFGQSSNNETLQNSEFEKKIDDTTTDSKKPESVAINKDDRIIVTSSGFSRIIKNEDDKPALIKNTENDSNKIHTTTNTTEEDKIIDKREVHSKGINIEQEKRLGRKQDENQISQEINDSEYVTVKSNESKNDILLDRLKHVSQTTTLLLKKRANMKTTTAFEAVLQVISDQIQAGVHIDIDELEKSLNRF